VRALPEAVPFGQGVDLLEPDVHHSPAADYFAPGQSVSGGQPWHFGRQTSKTTGKICHIMWISMDKPIKK